MNYALPFRRVRPIEIFIVILIANIVTMLVMNVLVLPVDFFLPLYACGLAAGYLLVKKVSLESPENASILLTTGERKLLMAGYTVMALLYILPRSGYLLEGFLGYSMDAVCWDDNWHIQELNSLINSARYPPISSFMEGKFLSHYYCAWMFPAFIYKLLPIGQVTIKVAMFLGKTVYALLILYAVAYLSYVVSRTKRQFFFLQYLIIFYSGASSLLVLIQPLQSHKWWMWDLFRMRIQISDFADLS